MNSLGWQEALHTQNQHWYPEADAPQVAAAFALQYLLQVPAQTMAYAVAHGPWLAAPESLTFDLGAGGSPVRVHLGRLDLLDPGLSAGERLKLAEEAYLAFARPLATAYPAIVHLGSLTRQGMVRDQWRIAVRDALGPKQHGAALVERESCCFLYALPGCVECAGCPRLRRRP